jgi:ATP-dependent protease ClpP protease subunit
VSDIPWRTTRRLYALHQPGNNNWYRILNQAEETGRTPIHIYDEIGYFGTSAGEFIKDLAMVEGAIDLHLNSPGGEVFDGITIYNALLSRGEGEVAVYIDGLAASITSVIAMAGDPVIVADSAQMMIHDGHTMAIGNAADLRDLADTLDRVSDTIASIYSKHAGDTPEHWRDLMRAQTWFSAQEMVTAGLADQVVTMGKRGRNKQNEWDMSVLQDAASVPYVGQTQPRHEPMTGTHAHDHAAYEATDHDDGVHMHRHTHANDADHHHSHSGVPSESAHEPGMGHLGVGPDAHSEIGWILDLITQVSPSMLNWDASAALAKCHSASDFRSICAGEKSSGAPDTQAHWALPHHNSPGSGPDKGGVVAALGRWNQTEGLKNKQAALSHLKAHARALGLPSGDDDRSTSELYDDEDVQSFINALRGAQ